MVDTTTLQATLTVDSDDIIEGNLVSFTIVIRNTIGSNASFWIDSVEIDSKTASLYNGGDEVSEIPYGSYTSLTARAYVPGVPGQVLLNVNIGYESGNTSGESSVSSLITVKGNLEINDKPVNDLMINNKRIIKLDSPNDTVWRNGVWFDSTYSFIGPDLELLGGSSTTITGNVYHHNHLVKNNELTIHRSNYLVHKNFVNSFDFFTEDGTLTVTRTLNGFSANGSQDASYTCNTIIDSGDIINFDITDISGSVYLNMLDDDDFCLEEIHLPSLNAENIQIKFNNSQEFTLYTDGDIYDMYASEYSYAKICFDIGSGSITIDNFYIEKLLSSAQLTSDNIPNASANLQAYRSYRGTRLKKITSDVAYFSLGGALSSEFSRLDMDIVEVNGNFTLRHHGSNLNLHEWISDDSHLTITRDKYYTEIFVDGQLIKSIKDTESLSRYFFYVYDECILKNVEIHNFAYNETVSIDSLGNAEILYGNQALGDVYFIGEFEDLPTIPFYIEDCTYKPGFTSTTGVVKHGSNSNAYEYSDNNDIGYFKGAVLSNGWDNTGLWECTFDLAYNHDTIRYTGLILLANPNNAFSGGSLTWGISGWEGPITGTPVVKGSTTNYVKDGHLTSLGSGQNFASTIDWHTIHMRKESPTCLVVWKNDDYENRVTYMWEDLSSVSQVTIGGLTNMASSITQREYGSTCIRNLRVKLY